MVVVQAGLVCAERSRPSQADSMCWRANRFKLPSDAKDSDSEAAKLQPVTSFCPECAERQFPC